MRYHVLATDYDGTLAQDGVVSERALDALARLRASGRRALLVTGRRLDDLTTAFPRLDLFDRVVAENGALVYDPSARSEEILGEAADPRFVDALRSRGIPLSVGRVVVGTTEPHRQAVLDAIHELGLELRLSFNKGSVMVLPAGITKATGLRVALRALGLSPHNAVGIGDAENDHAFLAECEAAVAVANALPAVQERADLVTAGARGDGFAELVDRLLGDDLRSLEPDLGRHEVLLGHRLEPPQAASPAGAPLAIQPYGRSVLVGGPSGAGKSILTTGLLERLAAAGYQFCLIDPEGDYQELGSAVVLGDPKRPPLPDEAFEILARPDASLVLNLLGIPLEDRPGFSQALLPRIEELRSSTGRPHWLIVDEAHHILPAAWQPGPDTLPASLETTLLVTVHPDRVSPAALAATDLVLALGDRPAETLSTFIRAVSSVRPRLGRPRGLPRSLAPGTALAWRPGAPRAEPFRVVPATVEQSRHRRKYAAGELPPGQSFFFRGPDDRLNLRAQNLALFLQIGDGVDDATWRFHLERGDFSTWMRETVKDARLADAVAAIERRGGSPDQTRAAIRDVVERRYTAPA